VSDPVELLDFSPDGDAKHGLYSSHATAEVEVHKSLNAQLADQVKLLGPSS
jgi:hypothetical protein